MKNKNDDINNINYDQEYNDLQKTLDASEISTPNVKNHQVLSKEKTIDFILKSTAVVLIGCSFLGFVKGIKKPTHSGDSNKESTSVSEEITDENQNMEYEVVLECPADVDNAAELKKLVDEANKNNEKDPKVSDTKLNERMVKFFNGKLTKEDLKGMTDDEIIEEVRQYSTKLFDVASASIITFKNMKENETFTYDSNESALAIAFTLLDNDGYTYKTYASLYDGNILNEQKKDIVQDNEKDYSLNSETFGKTIKKILDDKNVNEYEKALVATVAKAQYIIFEKEMTSELKNMFSKDFQGTYLNSAYSKFYNDMGIVTDVLYNECKEKTTVGEIEDKNPELADKYAGKTGQEDTSTLVEKGGDKSKSNKGKKEVIEEGTTRVEKEVVNPPKESETKIDKGGEQVGKPETEVTPSEVVTVEDKKPEPETTTQQEEVKPKDEEGNDIYTEDEFNDAKNGNAKNTSLEKTLGVFESKIIPAIGIIGGYITFKDSDEIANRLSGMLSKRRKRK